MPSVDPKLLRISLLTHEVELVRMIAARGGEMPFDWATTPATLLDTPGSRWKSLGADAQARAIDGVKATFVSLINRGVLIEREYTHDARVQGSLYIALTDGGRQVADQIAAQDAARRDVEVLEQPMQKAGS